MERELGCGRLVVSCVIVMAGRFTEIREQEEGKTMRTREYFIYKAATMSTRNAETAV